MRRRWLKFNSVTHGSTCGCHVTKSYYQESYCIPFRTLYEEYFLSFTGWHVVATWLERTKNSMNKSINSATIRTKKYCSNSFHSWKSLSKCSQGGINYKKRSPYGFLGRALNSFSLIHFRATNLSIERTTLEAPPDIGHRSKGGHLQLGTTLETLNTQDDGSFLCASKSPNQVEPIVLIEGDRWQLIIFFITFLNNNKEFSAWQICLK